MLEHIWTDNNLLDEQQITSLLWYAGWARLFACCWVLTCL